MTGNNCLLDTSIVLHVFKQNKQIAARLNTFTEVFIPLIVIGELYYGAYASADPERHIQQTNEFLLNCKITHFDTVTSTTYGKIKAELKRKGRPIPENDIWIAASAIQYDLPLFQQMHTLQRLMA